jgi:hypothetical protein
MPEHHVACAEVGRLGLEGAEDGGWRMADGGTTNLAIVARDNLPLHGTPHGDAKYQQNFDHCVPQPVFNHLCGIVTDDPPSPLAPPCLNTAICYFSSDRMSDCFVGILSCECKGYGHQFQRLDFSDALVL